LFIPDPDPDFLPIPDLSVKKTPDPGSGSATLHGSMFKYADVDKRACAHAGAGWGGRGGAGGGVLPLNLHHPRNRFEDGRR